MAYKGWTYHSDYEHEDDDVRKLGHWATHEDGTVVDLDFSPYNNRVRAVSLEAMVELGFPTRRDFGGIGPIYEEELLDRYIQHLKRIHEEKDHTSWPNKLLTILTTKRNRVTT